MKIEGELAVEVGWFDLGLVEIERTWRGGGFVARGYRPVDVHDWCVRALTAGSGCCCVGYFCFGSDLWMVC